jgi:hypothetical protein
MAVSAETEPSSAGQTAEAADEDRLLQALKSPEFSGRANNGSLRKALGWESEKFWTVRNRLIDKGRVQAAHGGPGGMTIITEESVSIPNGLSSEPSVALSDTTYTSEADLYKPMLKQIEDNWINEEGYDHSLVRLTAALGKRNTGGKWTRPDITAVAVQKFKFLRDPVFDVVSFEIKPRSDITVEAVFEALSHRLYTNRAFLILHISESDFDEQEREALIPT